MSMSKVRLYELTRELDIDTKEIMSICETLQISVKSHSSTISEAEADQIRAKIRDRVSDRPTHHGLPKTKEAPREAREATDKQTKQQILTVTTLTPSTSNTLNAPPIIRPESSESRAPERASTDRGASPAAPIAPPRLERPKIVRPPTRPSLEVVVPVAPERPVVPAVPAVEATPSTESAIAPSPPPAALTAELTPERPAEKPKPLEPRRVAESKRPAAAPPAPPVASRPQPPRPPSKPSPDKPSRTERPDKPADAPAKPVVVSRPTAPRPKERVEIGLPPTSAPRRPEAPRPSRIKDAVLIERGITAPTDPPRPMRAPLSAPKPPERPTFKDKSKEPDVEEPAPLTATPPKPAERDKLGHARPSKRGKGKRDDDDRDLETKEKMRLTKPKRFFAAEDDEDDFLDDEELQEMGLGSAAPQVSLSLARPTARPKPRMMATKPIERTSDVKMATGKKRTHSRDRRHGQEEPLEKPTKIVLRDNITVQDLAARLVAPETDIIRTLFLKGVMVNINQTLDIPTARMVATELGYEVEEAAADALALKTEMLEIADLENLQRRPPVVTIMGHVDHGKTTLLDSIRKTKVAQGEAGGITQHIGAYHVDIEHEGRKEQIVFLDTPGHEAFTAMRARGAKVTDIAVLVVAADDGVQPQTIEAISHARAAKVPIVVAINKIDKPEANPDRIRQELTEYELVDEAWGGDTVMVPVSAIAGQNLDTLLEMILLVAEVEDLRANPDRAAKGTVIEAHLDKARGPVATLLVQNGTLRVGDVLVAGSAFGKVRAMIDDRGKRVDVAGPSFAVEVLGLGDVPAAGDEFDVYLDEKEARAVSSARADQQRQSRLQQTMASRRITLGTLSAKAQEGELKELNLILKADVQGSVEAILNALGQLPQEEVQVRVLLAAPGEVTENDVELAAASEAAILAFNTSMATGARQAADELGVDVRDYSIIYKLLEDVQGAMEGLLEPELVEEFLGQAEVRAIFPVGKGFVAGCYVQNGKLVRNCNARIRRGKEVIYDGTLDSLKRMRDDAKEVATGFECGVGISKFADWKEGDIIEAYRMATKRRTLSM